jgi:hypothetical protein
VKDHARIGKVLADFWHACFRDAAREILHPAKAGIQDNAGKVMSAL